MNEEKYEDDLTKKLYQDTILNGRFTNSQVVLDLAKKINIYGENRQIEAMLKAQSAASIIQFMGDEEVARGIAIGMELGKPIFEGMGEEFLQSKVPNYTKSGLGVALTRVMLSGLKGKRIEKIYQGVEDALEGREDVSEETKAAMLATEIYDGANKFRDKDRFRGEHTAAMYSVFEGTEDNGTVCTSHPEELEEFRQIKSDKDRVQRNPIRKKELENAYKYYMKKINEIPKEFRKSLEEYDNQSIVAYFVASMGEQEVHLLYEQLVNIEKE